MLKNVHQVRYLLNRKKNQSNFLKPHILNTQSTKASTIQSHEVFLVNVTTNELKFAAKFDNTAVYQTVLPDNQYDINKLYGFSDNNAHHQLYSARVGWRWSDGALRLFAYVYNNGVVSYEELTSIPLNTEVYCSIVVTSTSYIFTVNSEVKAKLPRLSTTSLATGYKLYPYFGGDETAPHNIYILIKDL